MRKRFWDKRIPTLLGIFIITLSIGITTLLVKQDTIFQTKASPTQVPQNVRISNITDASFSVSYTTDDQIIGSINYGLDKNLGQSVLDDRDQEKGAVSNYKIHNITVRNLTPQTKYYFSITSGQNTYLTNDQPFAVTTGAKITSPLPKQNPIMGKIILPNGNPPQEGIVYVTTDGSEVISALAKSDGSYTLPLNLLRSDNFSSYYNFSPNTIFRILVFADSMISNSTITINQTNPVPTITISKDYDFVSNNSPVASTSTGLASFPTFSSTSSASSSRNNGPQILTPQKDQGFTDQQPLFKGTGLPNQNVQIIIHSNEQINTQLATDASGNWSYRPSTQLSPGTHTITLVTKDASGILKTITQSFVVYASGTQVSQSATPSATLTPTPSPLPTPTPVVLILTPTPEVSTQSSTLAATPSANKSPLPPTGNPSIITAGIVGIVISLIGGLLFLLTRGGISSL